MADSRNGAGNGSRLYEVNIWMWRYGRGQPRRVTVAEAELQRKAAISDARRRAADTMKRRRKKIWCYIADYIPYYIARALLSAI